MSVGKSKYFITFIDDYSGWCEVRFLHKKNETFTESTKVKSLLEKQTGVPLKCLRSDNGTEYLSRELNNFVKENGIQRQLTVANNPEQNGKAERRNRTLVEMARCLLIQAGLPLVFWAEAIRTANFIRNRCPSRSLNGKTPYEMLHGRKPDVCFFREFWCSVYILDRTSHKGKFEKKTKNGVFLGYSEESKGYRVWIPSEHKVEISRDVEFSEDKSPLSVNSSTKIDVPLVKTIDDNLAPDQNVKQQEDSESEDELKEENTDEKEETKDDQGEEPEKDVKLKRGPGRPKKVKSGKPGRPKKEYNQVEANICEGVFFSEVPVKQAVSSPDAEEWYNAMAIEMKSIIKNEMWDFVDRPSDRQVVGSRMILGNKYGADGTLERRKARIVARGFSQRPGIDFRETFAPVARLSSVRVAAAIAAEHDLIIRQLDVTAAYLNGTLDEEIFMEIPEMTEEALERVIRIAGKDSDIGKRARKMLNVIKEGNKVGKLK